MSGQLYSYAVRAVDPEGDPLTFTLDAAPAGLTIDPARGLILWSPTAAQLGPQAVKLRVDDGQGGYAVQSYSITVASSTTDQPPTITSTPSLLATVGTTLSLSGCRVRPRERDASL